MYKKIFFFAIFFCFGILMFFFPMLINFDLMPGDLKDARFVNYILEHGFLFLTRDNMHCSFWHAPFFYPNTNTLALSDVLLSEMFLYIPFRFFLSAQSALQIMLIFCCFLNYLSFFLLSKAVFKFNALLSSLCAFLFAFSLARYNQIEHIQLFSQFLSVFCVYFLFKKPYKILNFIFASCFLVLQFYTSFYLGWFTVFGGIVAIFVIFIKADTRKMFIDYIYKNAKNLLIFSAIFIILIIPLAFHYISIHQSFALKHWFLFNKFSPLLSYSVLDSLIIIPKLSAFHTENITGIGFFITLLSFLGWFKFKKYRLQTFMFIAISISCFYFSGIYDFIFKYIPSANAIRAGARCIFILLFLHSFFVCYFFKNIKNRFLFWIFLVIVLLENIPYPAKFNWTKTQHNERIKKYSIDKSCEAFFIDTKEKEYKDASIIWVDAMWISNIVSKPVLNGYSGAFFNVDKDSLSKKCIINIK